jgi:hypothetical protein
MPSHHRAIDTQQSRFQKSRGEMSTSYAAQVNQYKPLICYWQTALWIIIAGN